MKHFTASGLWFLDSDPSERVAGTLRYSDHGLFLKLLGGFKGGWWPKAEGYPVIRGVVGRNPYGDFVTLHDAFTKRTRLSSAGIGSEIIYCNRAVLGDSHLSKGYDEFEALDLTLSYLSDWFGRSGIVTEWPRGRGFALNVRYEQPEPLRLPSDGAVVTLGVSCRTDHSSHGFSISEQAHILLKPLPRLTPDQVNADFIRPLQNLLSFATDTPNAIEGVELRGERVTQGEVETNRKYHLVFKQIFRLKSKKDRLRPSDMLFTFDESQGAGLNVFQNWFEFTKKHEAFCTVYFASLYAPPRYLDEKFLRLMTALTLLTSSLGDVSQRTRLYLKEVWGLSNDRFTEEERTMLGHVLPTGPEVEMPFHLQRLLEEHHRLMNPLIGEDHRSFVRSLSETLSFAERRTTETSRPPFQGGELLDAMEKIRILIKAVVLKELGFADQQVASFIERNRYYIYMSSRDMSSGDTIHNP